MSVQTVTIDGKVGKMAEIKPDVYKVVFDDGSIVILIAAKEKDHE